MPSWETVDSESLTLRSHRGRLSSSPVLCGSNAPIGSIRNQRRLIANVYMHKIPRNRVFFLKDQRPEFHRSPEELAGMIHTATPILFQRGKRRCPVAIFRIIPSFEVRHTFSANARLDSIRSPLAPWSRSASANRNRSGATVGRISRII